MAMLIVREPRSNGNDSGTRLKMVVGKIKERAKIGEMGRSLVKSKETDKE